jgi:6-phosphogluconolactonase
MDIGDGRLSEGFYTDQHAGRPLSPSQPGPRAHGIVFSSDSRFAYVAELGLDRVYTYRLDASGRAMSPSDPPYVSVKARSGPRRLQLRPDGRFLYVNHETDSAVSVFEVNGGRLREVQSLSTLPADFTGNNTTAEIQIDAEGRLLYATNRGHDSIAVYSVDPAKGTLTMIETVPSLGRTPRNITIDPTNNYLLAANQNGGNVVVFRINPNRSSDADGIAAAGVAGRRRCLCQDTEQRRVRDQACEIIGRISGAGLSTLRRIISIQPRRTRRFNPDTNRILPPCPPW